MLYENVGDHYINQTLLGLVQEQAEGVILQAPMSPYVSGRSQHLLKLKVCFNICFQAITIFDIGVFILFYFFNLF